MGFWKAVSDLAKEATGNYQAEKERASRMSDEQLFRRARSGSMFAKSAAIGELRNRGYSIGSNENDD